MQIIRPITFEEICTLQKKCLHTVVGSNLFRNVCVNANNMYRNTFNGCGFVFGGVEFGWKRKADLMLNSITAILLD